MRRINKLTPKNVNEWNATFHKILLNYCPILVLCFTGDYASAFIVSILLSHDTVKELIKSMRGKSGT
jgi:hypothetical protein